MKFLKKSWIYLLIIVGLIVVAITIPLPNLYTMTAGPLVTLNKAVTLTNTSNRKEESIFVTTVSRRQATFFGALQASLSPYADIEKVNPETSDVERQDMRLVQQAHMANSQQTSVVQAFRLAGKEADLVMIGGRLIFIDRDQSELDPLLPGDIITKVNQKVFTNQEQLNGQTAVTVLRSNKEHDVSINFTNLTQDSLVALPAVQQREEQIRMDLGGVGGPSGGAMLTLRIYDLLTGQQLLQGRKIAGTGTITSSGTVGRVGGIAQKVFAAHNENMDVFFVPNDDVSGSEAIVSNYAEALKTKERLRTKMAIVPVKNMDDILNYLKK
ncbi:S16 family serine protease [Enterococcus crotali]|uniref:S16 family serine protease n=1 Tax=Enterococcus crotali TaxID=1453587 RepID=UPI0004715D5C|nr:S16 family serine protease [Enterococcus crotali]OTP50221.1 hypothetical protein A5881_001636 [Enterococcus termitis]